MEPAFHPDTARPVPLFFIIGMPRSGTTLLRIMCNHHPSIISPPESRFMLSLRKKFQHKSLEPHDVATILDYLKADRKITGAWKLNYPLLEQELHTCIKTGGNFEALCQTIYLHRLHIHPKQQVLWIGDKNPGYAMEIDWLQQTFPNARFIHLVRDYRDCIASHNRVFKKRAVNIHAASWVLTNQKIERSKAKIPDRFMTLRYEDLVTNPEIKTREVCQFLGVSFNEAMLKFYENIPGKSEFTKPIHPGNIGKYKQQLSAKQLACIEWICAGPGQTYGYAPSQEPRKKFFYPLAFWWGKRVFYYDQAVVNLFYRSPLWAKRSARKFYDFLFRSFRITTRHNHSEMKRQAAKQARK